MTLLLHRAYLDRGQVRGNARSSTIIRQFEIAPVKATSAEFAKKMHKRARRHDFGKKMPFEM
jgi:hypothetical protein